MLTFCGMKRLLITALLVASAVFAAGQSRPAVAVRVRFAKNRCSIRDKIELEIVRENVSHQRLAVSSLWFWGVMRTDIHVFDKAGHQIRTDVLPDSVPYPPKPYDFVVLGPGEFVGAALSESAKHFETGRIARTESKGELRRPQQPVFLKMRHRPVTPA